jgi:hypothetical protein
MWSSQISYYKKYQRNESKYNYDVAYIMGISAEDSFNLLNSSGNDNINQTSLCLVDNQFNTSSACLILWNSSTSVYQDAENSSSGDVEGSATVNLGLAVPMGIVMYLLSLVTVVGNAMVLHAIRTERRLQTVSTNNTSVS